MFYSPGFHANNGQKMTGIKIRREGLALRAIENNWHGDQKRTGMKVKGVGMKTEGGLA